MTPRHPVELHTAHATAIHAADRRAGDIGPSPSGSVPASLSTVSVIRETMRRQLRSRWFAFLAATVAGFVLMFARTPFPLMEQVFFTEDGRDYVDGLLNHGFLHTLDTVKTQYFVLGNLVLSQLSIWVWHVIGSGDITRLPVLMSFMANAFYAVAFALPWLLLRNTHPAYLMGLWLCTVFVPLGNSDFEIFGRISNTGYVFLYMSFVLAWYRHEMDEGPAVLAVDAVIAFSAWTNPLVFALFPLLLARYWRSRHDRLSDFVLRPTVISGVLLLLLCTPAALRIAKAPKRDNGHAEPIVLTTKSAIEMGVARNVLHPLVHPVYNSLGTASVLLSATLLAGAFVVFGRQERRWLYVSGALLVGCTSLVLVMTRPEVQPPPNYRATYPDRYYFAQNLIVLFMLTHLLEDFVSATRRKWRSNWLVPAALFVFYFSDVTTQSTFGTVAPCMVGQGDFRFCLGRAIEERAFSGRPGGFGEEAELLTVQTFPHKWTMRIPMKYLPPDLQRAAAVAMGKDGNAPLRR